MRDLVLKGFIEDYAEHMAFDHSNIARTFEAFAASSILRKYHEFDPTDIENDVLVGGGGDGGIDALSILINGRPIGSVEDVDFFKERLGQLDVDFVFIQAKSSSGFAASDIGQFVYGVEQFFSDKPTISLNDDIRGLRNVSEYIFRNSIHMTANPGCYLYFASAGRWQNSPDPTGRLESGRKILEQTKLFSAVKVRPIDAESLKEAYRELQRGVTKEVELTKVTTFPKIDGVDQAYIGLLPGDEFIRLICREDEDLNRDLFYDNVRDFQGGNPVNKEIHQTLSSEDKRDSFPLLNNGITVVARSIVRTGDNFRISDFQIVNGCQTTHILYANKETVTAKTYVPIKLVATHDSQVVGDVIKATNRQTAVQLEALESLSPFHRELEDLYNHRPFRSERIYYERRSKQYALDKIDPKNVVTLTAQTKSFVGMFLNEPHSHPRYYGELLNAYERRLFVKDHRPEAYYASGVALLALERLFRSGRVDRAWRQYKYHILMLLRQQIGGESMPKLNSNAMSAYALSVVDVLNDARQTEASVRQAIGRIGESQRKFNDTTAPPHRLRAFTEVLRGSSADIGSMGRKVDDGVDRSVEKSVMGTILWFDELKHFGFIETMGGHRVFFHESEIGEIPHWQRVSGTKVEFVVKERKKGPVACDIRSPSADG